MEMMQFRSMLIQELSDVSGIPLQVLRNFVEETKEELIQDGIYQRGDLAGDHMSVNMTYHVIMKMSAMARERVRIALTQKDQVPKTLSQALRLAADQQDIIEEQQKKIASDEPKVRMAVQLADQSNLYGLREVASLHEVGQEKLKNIMFQHRYWYRDQSTGMTRAYSHFKSEFPLKTEIINGITISRLMISGKGLEIINNVLNKYS